MGRFHSAPTPGVRRGAVDHAGSCYTPRGGRGAEARRDLALYRNGADVESTVTSYRVTDVQPLRPTGRETDTLPRRLLGRVLTPQDVVNLGGFFEGKDRASIFHEEQTWVLTLEAAAETDHWNAVPHGRDEGEYDTEVQVRPERKRLFIP